MTEKTRRWHHPTDGEDADWVSDDGFRAYRCGVLSGWQIDAPDGTPLVEADTFREAKTWLHELTRER